MYCLEGSPDPWQKFLQSSSIFAKEKGRNLLPQVPFVACSLPIWIQPTINGYEFIFQVDNPYVLEVCQYVLKISITFLHKSTNFHSTCCSAIKLDIPQIQLFKKTKSR